MMIRTALSDKARAELIDFCAKHLKDGLDPVRYANGFEDEADLSISALFEISGRHSKSGNPTTVSFHADADFYWEDVE
jgi:hypothetical protein